MPFMFLKHGCARRIMGIFAAAAIGFACLHSCRPPDRSTAAEAVAPQPTAETAGAQGWADVVKGVMARLDTPVIADISQTPANWKQPAGPVSAENAWIDLGLEAVSHPGSEVLVLQPRIPWDEALHRVKKQVAIEVGFPTDAELTRLAKEVRSHGEARTPTGRRVLEQWAKASLRSRLKQQLEGLNDASLGRTRARLTGKQPQHMPEGILMKVPTGLTMSWPLSGIATQAVPGYGQGPPAEPLNATATEILHTLAARKKAALHGDCTPLNPVRLLVQPGGADPIETARTVARLAGCKLTCSQNTWRVEARKSNPSEREGDAARKQAHSLALRNVRAFLTTADPRTLRLMANGSGVMLGELASSGALLEQALTAKVGSECIVHSRLLSEPLADGTLIIPQSRRFAPFLRYRGSGVPLHNGKRYLQAR